MSCQKHFHEDHKKANQCIHIAAVVCLNLFSQSKILVEIVRVTISYTKHTTPNRKVDISSIKVEQFIKLWSLNLVQSRVLIFEVEIICRPPPVPGNRSIVLTPLKF